MTPTSHIFVTGGSGFLGSYILRTLVSLGYTNITAMRRAHSRMGLVGDIVDKINWVEADLFDYDLLVEVLADVDVVMHSAAIISFVKSDEKEMFKVNVEGTAHLLNAALECNVDKFLHVSSIAALGRTPDQPLVNETSKFQHSKLDSGYGLSKHLSEMEVWRAGSEGLNVTIINPAMIMGAGYWDTGTSKLIDTVFHRLKYYPLGTTGFVDVRDVARMSIQLLEENHMHTRFLCCGENMKIQRMIGIICQAFNKPSPSIGLSPWLRGIAWRVEWMRSKLTGSTQLITRATLNSSSQDFTFDSSKSIEELNFKYTPLTETIIETCRLYKASHAMKTGYAAMKI